MMPCTPMAMDNIRARVHKITVLLKHKPILEPNSKATLIKLFAGHSVLTFKIRDKTCTKEVPNIKIQADKKFLNTEQDLRENKNQYLNEASV
jgi:hypothetical protein